MSGISSFILAGRFESVVLITLPMTGIGKLKSIPKCLKGVAFSQSMSGSIVTKFGSCQVEFELLHLIRAVVRHSCFSLHNKLATLD
jgi:hypothetical protein